MSKKNWLNPAILGTMCLSWLGIQLGVVSNAPPVAPWFKWFQRFQDAAEQAARLKSAEQRLHQHLVCCWTRDLCQSCHRMPFPKGVPSFWDMRLEQHGQGRNHPTSIQTSNMQSTWIKKIWPGLHHARVPVTAKQAFSGEYIALQSLQRCFIYERYQSRDTESLPPD